MADQVITGLQLQVGLDTGKFDASSVRLTANAKKITEAFNNISGLKADQKLQQVQQAVERLGGVANLSAPQVARLRGELEKLASAGAKIPKSLELPKLNTAGFDKALSSLGGAQLSGLTGSLGSVGGALAAIGPVGLAAAAGVGAVVGIMGAAIAAAAQYGSQVQDLAEKTGFSTDAVQELGYAVRQSGGDFENVAKSASVMERQIAAGASVFKSLGLDVRQLRELKPEEAFIQVAEAIRKLDDPYKQAQAAAQAFGKAGVELLPAIRAGLSDLSAEAHEFGQVLSKDGVEAGDRFGDALERASKAWTVLKATVGGKIITTLQLDVVLNNLAKEVGQIGEGQLPFKKTGGGLLGLIDAFQGNGPDVTKRGGAGAAQSAVADLFKGPADLKLPGLDAQIEALSKVGAESQKAKKDLAEFEAAARQADQEIKSLAQALGQHFDELAKARAKRENRADAQDALLGGSKAAQFESEKIQAAIIDVGGVSELSAKQVEFLAQKFFDLSKAGADIPQDLGEISQKADELNFDAATNSMAEAEDAAVELLKTLAQFGQGPLAGLSGEAIDALFGRIPAQAEAATKATFDFKGALEGVTLIAGLMGDNLGSVIGILGNIGDAFANAKTKAEKFQAIASGVGQIGGVLSKSHGKTGGTLQGAAGGAKLGFSIGGAFGPQGAVIGGVIGGIAGGVLGFFKAKKAQAEAKKAGAAVGLTYGKEIADKAGISLQELEKQIVATAKATGKSIEQVGKEMREAFLKDKLSGLQQQAKAGAGQIISGLGGFGAIKGAADAQGRLFAKQFWAVVEIEGFGPAVEAFKATFDKLSPELQAAIPDELKNIFKFAENADFSSALDGIQALTEGFKGTVATIGLTKETLADYGQVAQAAFDQAKAGALASGATEAEATKAALQAIIPLIAAEADAAKRAGVELDANTQALIDQAKAAGISIPTDPLLQVLDVLKEIADTLKAIGGITVNPKVNITTTGGDIPIPGATGRPKGFALGGIGRFDKRGTPAVLHGLEAVLPMENEDAFKRVFRQVVGRVPGLAASALAEITRPAAGSVPHFAQGGFTDSSGSTDLGGFGALTSSFGGGISVSLAPGAFSPVIQIDAAGGDAQAIAEAVTGAIDQEVPVFMDALARTIRREISNQ